MVGPYERSGLIIDTDSLEVLYPVVFTSENESIRIYQVHPSQEVTSVYE